MSETPNNKPSNINRRPPRKPKPRTDSASTGQSQGVQAASPQNGKPKRRPAQKQRRPQNQNKNQGQQQRNADNFGNQANGNSLHAGANSNRRTPNGNRSQQNGRRPQNRGSNGWSQSTDSYGAHDQYRSSDWYREDQARFAAQQIAVERAEAGKSGGTANNNQNKRNPRNRNNRTNNNAVSAGNGVQNSEQGKQAPAPVVTHLAAAKKETGVSDVQAQETSAEKNESGKREAGKSRRAPWRTQKHAAGRKNDSDDKTEASKGNNIN